jgi:hypothetical protein
VRVAVTVGFVVGVREAVAVGVRVLTDVVVAVAEGLADGERCGGRVGAVVRVGDAVTEGVAMGVAGGATRLQRSERFLNRRDSARFRARMDIHTVTARRVFTEPTFWAAPTRQTTGRPRQKAPRSGMN